MVRPSRLVSLLVGGGIIVLAVFCCCCTDSLRVREGLAVQYKSPDRQDPATGARMQPRANARACGCDPWSEHCVVPPHDSPGYGCIRSFEDHGGGCGEGPKPNDGPWVQWGFGHGHPLTAGHREEETKRIASAVFGADSDLTRQLKNEAVRRDARQAEAERKKQGSVSAPAPAAPGDAGKPGGANAHPHAHHRVAEQGAALHKLPPPGGAHDLALHPDPPKPASQCGSLTGSAPTIAHETAMAVYADPVTTYTDMPVHLPTSHDLHPDQDGSGGKCRPSVTGIFQVCGPLASAP